MNEARKEERASLSFYRIRNDFDDISLNSTNNYRVYQLKTPYTLHMFHLVICDYLYQIFITKLSGDTSKNLKISQNQQL